MIQAQWSLASAPPIKPEVAQNSILARELPNPPHYTPAPEEIPTSVGFAYYPHTPPLQRGTSTNTI